MNDRIAAYTLTSRKSFFSLVLSIKVLGLLLVGQTWVTCVLLNHSLEKGHDISDRPDLGHVFTSGTGVKSVTLKSHGPRTRERWLPVQDIFCQSPQTYSPSFSFLIRVSEG